MRLRKPVGFLPGHDVIDQAHKISVRAWHPRPCRWGQLGLEELQERHEIPDGKDMMLHEDAELFLCLDGSKDGMGLDGFKRGF
jgi:hypothetical protein